MNLNDSIVELLKAECGVLTLGASPEGKIYGALEHHVATTENSKMEITHKAQGTSVTGVVQQIVSQYNHAELQRTKISLAPKPATSKIIKP